MESQFSWMNGRVVPNAEATVPFMTNALHHVLLVFEGIRCYNTIEVPPFSPSRPATARPINSSAYFGVRNFYDMETHLIPLPKRSSLRTISQIVMCALLLYLVSGYPATRTTQRPNGIAVWEWNAEMGPRGVCQRIALTSLLTRHHGNVT